jgi:hypothetical protein
MRRGAHPLAAAASDPARGQQQQQQQAGMDVRGEVAAQAASSGRHDGCASGSGAVVPAVQQQYDVLRFLGAYFAAAGRSFQPSQGALQVRQPLCELDLSSQICLRLEP